MLLPVSLVLTIVLAASFPQPGRFLESLSLGGWQLRHAAILIVFLLSGLRLAWSDLGLSRGCLVFLCCGVAINLGLGPLLAVGIVESFSLPEGMRLGMLVVGCVPTTLSSGVVIVRNAGGNVAWALLLTVLLTAGGTLLMPFLLALCLGAATELEMDLAKLLLMLATLVLAPLFSGMLWRHYRGEPRLPLKDHLPSFCVIIIVWLTVSVEAERVRSMGGGLTPASLLLQGSAALGFHALLLAAAWGTSRLLRWDWRTAIALQVIASQKTLPLAVTALVALSASGVPDAVIGAATIYCVLSNMLIIVGDSIYAQRYVLGRS